MKIVKKDTAILFTDPQNEVLSESGGAWPLVRDNIRKIGMIGNMEHIFQKAKTTGFQVFVSPHYYYPTDDAWKFRDPLGALMPEGHMFARRGILDLGGFSGSGADWLNRFKRYIEGGESVVVAPHKIYGPETSDLTLQLRKRGIQKVLVGGMLANMCVEAHMRELLEQGFEVGVVVDAIAAARHPVWGDGYAAALINFNYLASAVLRTGDLLSSMQSGTTEEVPSDLPLKRRKFAGGHYDEYY